MEAQGEGGNLGISGTPRLPMLCPQAQIPATFTGGTTSPKVRVFLLPLKAADTPPAPGLLPQHCRGVPGNLMRSNFIKNKSILVVIWSK